MKKIYITVLFFIINIATMCLNFAVSPTKFEVDLSKNKTHEIYILNNTPKVLRLDIFTEIPNGYENSNLNDSIIIYPQKISIKPGGNKTIYFKVKKKENKNNKNFKSLIVFREVLPNNKEIDKNQNIQLDFITEIAIGVSGK